MDKEYNDKWSLINERAKMMANVLEANLVKDDTGKSDVNLTQNGWDELHTLFGEVAMDQRAEQFVAFLEELQRREIVIDPTMFEG